MKASKLFTAIAAIAFAGSAFAADVPAANASAAAAAAAAQSAAAARSLTHVPAAKTGLRTRAEVRTEAAEAARNHRATEASQFDWITR